MHADHFRYFVPSLSCPRCEAAVSEEVRRVSGVEAVAIDLVAKRVDVYGSALSDEALRETMAQAGYPVAR